MMFMDFEFMVEVTGGGRSTCTMERIKNFISPRSRRKNLNGDQNSPLASPPMSRVRKMFGVPLEELMNRAPPDAVVPPVVSRICEYIYRYGLDSVGLFRVSGSVRVVERMRMQFELTGDVNMEEEGDVAATAGLLRVFLRDLPDTLVPGHMTQQFFSAVKDPMKSRDGTLSDLKQALSLLPEENFNVLKYIASLLVVVAANESENKMSSYALAIVFGPNVFKYELNSGLEGLRDMDASKDIMQLFISEYDALFAEEGDPSPAEFWEKCHVKKSPPPRPPPPKVQSLPLFSTTSSPDSSPLITSTTMSSSSTSLDYRPIPSPRKIKNLYDSGSDTEGPSPTIPMHSSIPLYSPRDDFEHSRAQSPFILECETHSIIESPMITARTHEFVEKTIVETISEHIFGGMDFNQNSGPHSPTSPQKSSFDVVNFDGGSSVDVPAVKPRTSVLNKQQKTQANASKASHSSQEWPRDESANGQLRDFDSLERTDMLTGHKKPQGPPRRSPSRKHRRSWEPDSLEEPDLSSLDNPTLTKGNFLQSPKSEQNKTHNNQSMADGDKENKEDFFEKETVMLTEEDQDEDNRWIHCDGEGSPTIKAKSMRRMETGDRVLSPQPNSFQNSQQQLMLTSSGPNPQTASAHKKDLSPTTSIKLFIPPLDFTTLHEHVEGVDPIPVSTDQTGSQGWMKAPGHADGQDNVAIISPRSNKLKKKNDGDSLDSDLCQPLSLVVEAPMSPSAGLGGSGYFSRASVNTDIPPSPPIQQDIYKKHSDDEGSHRLRQLTKKIQGLKKKIKSFEESFERDHGYRPTQGEKAANPDIKKYINELSKARKDLKRGVWLDSSYDDYDSHQSKSRKFMEFDFSQGLKEETEKGNRSRHNSGASSSGVEPSPPAAPTVSSTLEFIMKCLKEKRQEAGRPEDVQLMSREQVHEEKLAIQRALLHFEGLHGRPSTREDKDLMRPLYDRYRAIKRIIAKPISPRNSLELQTVPEDQMIEIPVTYSRNPVLIPTAEEDEEAPRTPDTGGTEFMVTRDFAVLRDLDISYPRSQQDRINDTGMQIAGGGSKESGDGDSGRSDDSGGDAHLHELSLTELHVEIETSRGHKKRLRRVLREYEESFWAKNGRKVSKEDRHPLQEEYGAYKKVKARLRLLEALVLKHHEA